MLVNIFSSKGTKRTDTQFVRYIIIGVTSLLIDVGLLYILTEYISIPYLISSGISFWVALLFNFQLNKTWSFDGGKKDYIKQFTKYMILVGFNFIFTIGFMYYLTDVLNIYYMYSKIFIVALITIWNFILYKKVIFKKNG